MSMIALLWKDMWVNRSVLAYAAVALTVPYLILLIRGLFGTWDHWWHFQQLSMFVVSSMMLSTITSALLGGYAFAAERADRSAEFLAYLPPSRLATIVSKTVFAAGVGLALVLIHLSIILYLCLSLQLPGSPGVVDLDLLIVCMAVSTLMFGTAWLCSTVTGGPALAAGFGMLSSIAAICGMYFGLQRIIPLDTITQYFNILCIAVGVTCYVVGTVYYIRRFSP